MTCVVEARTAPPDPASLPPKRPVSSGIGRERRADVSPSHHRSCPSRPPGSREDSPVPGNRVRGTLHAFMRHRLAAELERTNPRWIGDFRPSSQRVPELLVAPCFPLEPDEVRPSRTARSVVSPSVNETWRCCARQAGGRPRGKRTTLGQGAGRAQGLVSWARSARFAVDDERRGQAHFAEGAGRGRRRRWSWSRGSRGQGKASVAARGEGAHVPAPEPFIGQREADRW